MAIELGKAQAKSDGDIGKRATMAVFGYCYKPSGERVFPVYESTQPQFLV
jgi:hypothetical protein